MNLIQDVLSKHSMYYVSENQIKINSTKYTSRQFSKFLEKEFETVKKNFSPTENIEYYKLLERNGGTLESLSDKVFASLKQNLYQQLKDKTVTRGDHEMEGDSFSYAGHIETIDIVSGEHKVYNTVRGEMTDLHIEEWQKWLFELPSPQMKAIKEQTIRGLIKYDPFDDKPSTVIEYKDQTINRINSHIVPDWRKSEIVDPKLPPLFEKFLNYFVPDETSRSYVIHWLHYMLVDRNNTHLLLHGAKGIGKTTLANICRRLVGSSNYKILDVKFWESRFNNELKNRRVIYMDEHNINQDNIAQLKAYANDTISIEEKGKNVERDHKNHASYIISNNDPEGNEISSDDRRFSVPIIATEKMNMSWSQSELKELKETIDDNDEFIGHIGWWLIKHGNIGSFDNQAPLKTNLFYYLVEASMSLWKRKLIEAIEAREYEQIPLDSIDTYIDVPSGRIGGRVKIERFLANHTDRDGGYYGSLKLVKGLGRCIVPSDKYKVVELEDEEERTVSSPEVSSEDLSKMNF